MYRWCVVAAVLLLVACGEEAADDTPPGAGGGVLQIHRDDHPEPIAITCRRIVQVGAGMREMALTGVEMRLPLDDGVWQASAPLGRFAPRSQERASFDGPVALLGVIDGQVSSGIASGARLDGGGRVVIFEDAVVVHQGQRQRFASAAVDRTWGGRNQVRPVAGEPLTRPAAALAIGVLAALPDGLSIPPAAVTRPK